MPAIFWTTDAAIVVLPCAVSSASRAKEPTVAVGVVAVDVDADDADAEVGVVILEFSRCWVDGVRGMHTNPHRSREFTRLAGLKRRSRHDRVNFGVGGSMLGGGIRPRGGRSERGR